MPSLRSKDTLKNSPFPVPSKEGPFIHTPPLLEDVAGEANCQQLLQQEDSIYLPVSTELKMPLYQLWLVPTDFPVDVLQAKIYIVLSLRKIRKLTGGGVLVQIFTLQVTSKERARLIPTKV